MEKAVRILRENITEIKGYESKSTEWGDDIMSNAIIHYKDALKAVEQAMEVGRKESEGNPEEANSKIAKLQNDLKYYKKSEEELIAKFQNELRYYKEKEEELNSQIRYKHIENISDIKSLQNMLLISNSGDTHKEKNYLTQRTSDLINRIIEEKIKKLDSEFDMDELPF